MNFKNKKKFTESLCELYVEQNLSVAECLEVMKNSVAAGEDKKINKAAAEILESLNEGEELSYALSRCSCIKFDPSYIYFIDFAQLTGKLESILLYLKGRCERRYENQINLITAIIYPLFIILLSIAGAGILIFYFPYLFGESGIGTQNYFYEFLKAFLVMVGLSTLAFYLVIKNLKENEIYESFLAAGFLVKSGLSIGNAMGLAVLISGPESYMGKLFADVKGKIELGMDLKTAFGLQNKKKKNIPGLEEALFFAQHGGEKNDVFEKIAGILERENQRKQKILMILIEPVFVGIAGVFLLLLTMNCLMPVITNAGFNL